jgi:hypothetical protein
MSNVISLDKTMVETKNAIRSADTTFNNAMNGVDGAITMDVLGGIGGVLTGNLMSPVNGMDNVRKTYIDSQNSINTYQSTLSNIQAAMNQRVNELRTAGTLGQIVPPDFKLANSFNLEGSGYTFIVRKTSLSPRDRQRADRFFTAFGYNVDNEILNNVSQLQNRTRFTFIMADDVNILSVSDNTNLTRLRDTNTVNMIKQRFSAGLRIWKTAPDYDWSSPNPII